MWFWFFIGSFLFNLFLLLYVRWLLRSVEIINEDVSAVLSLIGNFKEHTRSIYELEMFYGDETLKALMTHASELTEKLRDLDLLLDPPSDLEQEGPPDDESRS